MLGTEIGDNIVFVKENKYTQIYFNVLVIIVNFF